MKPIAALILLFGSSGFSFSQDTLRDVSAAMYSLEYYLFPDNSFESEFVHCTGITYGKGTYQKKWNKIVFTFDSIPVPDSFYTCSNTAASDSIYLTLLSAHDSTAFWAIVGQAGQWYNTDENGKLTLPQHADSISVRFLREQLIIYPAKDSCNNYTIYLRPVFITYENTGQVIIKKENANDYYLPYVVWDEDPEKPWTKGIKRKGATIYRLIPGPENGG